MTKLQLGFNLCQEDLYSRAGLLRVDAAFYAYLEVHDADAHAALTLFRQDPSQFSDVQYNQLMFAVAPWITAFLLALFDIEQTYHARYDGSSHADILSFREHYLTSSHDSQAALSDQDFAAQTQWLCDVMALQEQDLSQAKVIAWGLALLSKNDCANRAVKNRLQQWCLAARERYAHGLAFQSWYVFWRPHKFADCRVRVQGDVSTGFVSEKSELLSRDDFALVPSQWNAEHALLHADYCQYCHDRSVDYCRTGFLQKKGDPSRGFRTNKQGQSLQGCPLDQKISQMHWFVRHQQPMSAWIVTMIDNPFCLITGHRICNDCMQSCIYQKQDPVDTPQVESRIVKDILDLPWGVELYDLLMKWHPLRKIDAVPSACTNHRVLVMGLGPAGFSMMHYLWMRGCSVTGMDGAHLEPWPYGDVFQPIASYASLHKPLQSRERLGFGGVCEYGITSRWDKNLLSVIYLSLLRRQRCHLLGNTRFGGTLTVEDAWRLGYSHLVLALGAGLPKALNIQHSLAPGMRQASDFLMQLHTLGAQGDQNRTSLTLEMPCVVIGAGLTAVDTATEAQAYYLHLVQLVFLRLSRLIDARGESVVRSYFSEQAYQRLHRWFVHGQAVQQEKHRASQLGRSACFRALLNAWGGVRMVYRRALESAPAYRNNHDELQAALESGIIFQTHTKICAAGVDAAGAVNRLRCLQPWSILEQSAVVIPRSIVFYSDFCRCFVATPNQSFAEGMIIAFQCAQSEDEARLGYWEIIALSEDSIDLRLWQGDLLALKHAVNQDEQLQIIGFYRDATLPARSILVATGSLPNTAYEYEHRGHFARDGAFYQLSMLAEDGLTARQTETEIDGAFFTSYNYHHKRVSVIGDLHPHFHGSVVKALASSQAAAGEVMRHLSALGCVDMPLGMVDTSIESLFCAQLIEKKVLFDDYYCLTIRAPWVVEKFRPGMMVKLQAYLFGPSAVAGALGCEAVACQPFDYDIEKQTLSFVLRCDGAASRAVCQIPEGGSVSLMGPTGVALTQKVYGQRVLILADEARLMSACLYRQYYVSLALSVDFYVQYSPRSHKLLSALGLDQHVQWITSESSFLSTVGALSRYHRIIFHGGFAFVKRFYQFCCHHMGSDDQSPQMIGYVGGPMQCMLKGICAQCLQWQIDPESGQRTKAVFSCSWQDQPLELVDLEHFQQRHESCQAFSVLNERWADSF